MMLVAYASSIMLSALCQAHYASGINAKRIALGAGRRATPTNPICLLSCSWHVAAQKFFKNLKYSYARSRVLRWCGA